MSPIIGIIDSQKSGHLYTIAGSYEPLASITVPSGGLSSIVFGSIPQTYAHLQIRTFHQSTGSAESYMQFNNDTAANYKIHYLYGDGASAVAGVGSVTTGVSFNYSGGTGSIFGASVVDILDYTSTNKNKTTRALGGYDANGSGLSILYSGLWFKTPEAITSIKLFPNTGNFAANSSFSLYGIKG